MNTNGHSPDKVDGQAESTMYFEESLETCGDIATSFEESINTVPLSEVSSIAEKWDCETIEVSALKVHSKYIQKLDT